jgi:hypothetical protein
MGDIERCGLNKNELIWEVNRPTNKIEKECDLHGALFVDVDGTLTRPGSMYAIDGEALDVLTELTDRGVTCIFNTGATLDRLESKILDPIFSRLDQKYNNHQRVTRIFRDRIIAMPENGSATLLSTDVEIIENQLYFLWHVLHPLHVPNKQELRNIIEDELVPLRKESFVIGDRQSDRSPREYILSWKGLTNTLDLVEEIKKNIIPKHPEINWKDIEFKAARKTIDFIHVNSGKEPSSRWVLEQFGSISGPVLGFGDLGDEFGRVVPTINVNQGKPNEFRKRGVGAMELTQWELLPKDRYIINGLSKNITVRDKTTDKEINVLRDEKGEVIFAIENKKCGFRACVKGKGKKGYPVEIKPASVCDKNGDRQVMQDAGKGTAFILRDLVERGYFNLK